MEKNMSIARIDVRARVTTVVFTMYEAKSFQRPGSI